jgi:multidrug transporter EmrE-like cation transporter
MSNTSDPRGPALPATPPASPAAPPAGPATRRAGPADPPAPAPQRRRAGDEPTPGRHHLSAASFVLLISAVATAAAGQVMLKHGMQAATARAAHSRGSLAAAAITSPWVLTGLLVFGVSAIAWLAVLSRVPLSVAYPFNALGYLGILTASILILHERASIMTWAGSLLVVSGLIIVVLARP